MAHKTRVGGTNYDISGGIAQVSGTDYSISNGRTLVGGTAYDISFSGLPAVGKALNDCTWAQIGAISDAGLAADYFSVGDTKTITLNGTVATTTFSNLSIDVFIIGIDHNSAVEGTNRIHFQLGRISGVDVALCDSNYNTIIGGSADHGFKMGDDNEGGWADSYMRTSVLGTSLTSSGKLLTALPSDLRAVMKTATKYTANGAGEYRSGMISSTDYLWLLSEYEVLGSTKYANSYESSYLKQYDYYATEANRVKYKHSASTTAAKWYLRSAVYDDENYYCSVDASGANRYATSETSLGIAPVFCV